MGTAWQNGPIEEPLDVIANDCLLPSQYFDRIRTVADEPLKRLMLAVLEQGIDDYLSNREAVTARRRRLYNEAQPWLELRGEGPFSFEALCETFDIEPNGFRKAILACQGTIPRRTPASVGRVNTQIAAVASRRESYIQRKRLREQERRTRPQCCPGCPQPIIKET